MSNDALIKLVQSNANTMQSHTHTIGNTGGTQGLANKIGNIGEFWNLSYIPEDVQATLFGDDYSPTEFYDMKKDNTQLIRFKDDKTCMIGQEEISFNSEKELGEAIIAKFAKMSLQGD